MKTHLTLLFLTLYTCVTSLHGNHQEAVDFVESLLFDNPSTSSQEDESLFLQKCQRAPQFQEEEPVEHPQILLFISSSVPVQSWQTFSPDLETLGGRFVLQGMPSNSFQELVKLVKTLKQAGVYAPISIDPDAYKRYQIKSVPTLILDTGSTFDQAIGNVPIPTSLRLFIDSGETSVISTEYIEKLSSIASFNRVKE